MTVRLLRGDCLEEIPRLVADSVVVDAIVTDPPYHLSEPPHVAGGGFGGRRSTERQAARAGFMGKAWDGGDIAFRPETWATIGTALKPGGFLLAFGGSRTHHCIWSAIEAAGFVIQDTIMWLYGSGFPKGRTQLKPSFELICVAYKPGGKRELQIDECRIGTAEDTSRSTNGHLAASCWLFDKTLVTGGHAAGRWPANVCLSVPEDEYELRPNVSVEQRKELYRWLSENP